MFANLAPAQAPWSPLQLACRALGLRRFSRGIPSGRQEESWPLETEGGDY